MNYHEIIKKKRKELGFTQKEVAKTLFIEHNTYSQYETGKRKMDVEMFMSILQCLKIDISEVAPHLVALEKDETTNLRVEKDFSVYYKFLQTNEIGKPLSCSIIHIDNLNHLNKDNRYDNCETLLREVGSILNRYSDEEKNVFFLGSNIFAILKTENSQSTNAIIENIQQELTHLSFPVTFSIGVIHLKNDFPDFQNLFHYSIMTVMEASLTKNRIIIREK